MKIDGFSSPVWDGRRIPYQDELWDMERRREYWNWSNDLMTLPIDNTRLLANTQDGRKWAILETQGQADFEAYYMQHSVGYNWDHYSAIGDIYGLRDHEGIPRVTILVANNTVVHARRAQNTPLSPADKRDLVHLADIQGWNILPDEQL